MFISITGKQRGELIHIKVFDLDARCGHDVRLAVTEGLEGLRVWTWRPSKR